MGEIVDTSRAFFEEVVQPILERDIPDIAGQAACGMFGYGSECYGMDDQVSRDHHFGLRVDMLLPDELHQSRAKRSPKRSVNSCPRAFADSTFGKVTLRERVWRPRALTRSWDAPSDSREHQRPTSSGLRCLRKTSST